MICSACRALQKQYLRVTGNLHNFLQCVGAHVPPSARPCVALLVVELVAKVFDMALAELRGQKLCLSSVLGEECRGCEVRV